MSIDQVIIAGSRSFNNPQMVDEALREWELNHGPIAQVISGAARGADKLGEEWALRNDKQLLRMPAEWNKHGRMAGYKRNEEMAKVAHGLVAFWDQESRGTMHMIWTMESMKKPYQVVRY